jgi:molecular chaperone GrpE
MLTREEILRRFEAWLDGVLAAEEPPQGITAELLSSLATETGISTDGRCDLYSLWAAVTALTQEIRLQGRSFKQLNEALAPLADLAPQLPAMQREAQERARREMLDVLLDLRDRLGRGLEAARVSQAKMRESLESGWSARVLARHKALRQAFEAVAALQQGCALSLDRLNEVLAQFDVREIVCQGQPFDPNSMHAVDVVETERAAEGTVVEVYRAGYEWKGEVYRPAQVKVARRPATAFAGDHKDE